MLQVWRGPKGKIFLCDDPGMGSPMWDHWAILLRRPDGMMLRVELHDSGEKVSRDGKYKVIGEFRDAKVRDFKENKPCA